MQKKEDKVDNKTTNKEEKNPKKRARENVKNKKSCFITSDLSENMPKLVFSHSFAN